MYYASLLRRDRTLFGRVHTLGIPDVLVWNDPQVQAAPRIFRLLSSDGPDGNELEYEECTHEYVEAGPACDDCHRLDGHDASCFYHGPY